MGEIADMMLDGTMCQQCGEFICDGEDGDGYPVTCASCIAQNNKDDAQQEKKKRKGKK